MQYVHMNIYRINFAELWLFVGCFCSLVMSWCSYELFNSLEWRVLRAFLEIKCCSLALVLSFKQNGDI